MLTFALVTAIASCAWYERGFFFFLVDSRSCCRCRFGGGNHRGSRRARRLMACLAMRWSWTADRIIHTVRASARPGALARVRRRVLTMLPGSPLGWALAGRVGASPILRRDLATLDGGRTVGRHAIHARMLRYWRKAHTGLQTSREDHHTSGRRRLTCGVCGTRCCWMS